MNQYFRFCQNDLFILFVNLYKFNYETLPKITFRDTISMKIIYFVRWNLSILDRILTWFVAHDQIANDLPFIQ